METVYNVARLLPFRDRSRPGHPLMWAGAHCRDGVWWDGGAVMKSRYQHFRSGYGWYWDGLAWRKTKSVWSPRAGDPLVLRGAADYGFLSAYEANHSTPTGHTYETSVEGPAVSRGLFYRDPDDGPNPPLRARATTECYYCVPCFRNFNPEDIAKPRTDVPAGFAQPTPELSFTAHHGGGHWCDAIGTYQITAGWHPPVDDGPVVLADGTVAPGSAADLGWICPERNANPPYYHLVGSWYGQGPVIPIPHCGPNTDDTEYQGYVELQTYCRRNDNGRYDALLTINYVRWGLPSDLCYPCWDCCSSSYHMIRPESWPIGSYGCYEIDESLLCKPTGEYILFWTRAKEWMNCWLGEEIVFREVPEQTCSLAVSIA